MINHEGAIRMGKMAIISGATGGLGKAMALACATRGYDLFLTDISAARLELLATGIQRQFAVQIICQACNLTDPAAFQGLWADIVARKLHFSLLINVAGVDFEGKFMDIDGSLLSQIVRLNVESVINMTWQAITHRDPSEKMNIINVSSLAAFYPMPVKAVYAASKRFLLNWSLALSQELSTENIQVMALCPAGMPTNESCMNSIKAQGLAGSITTMNVSTVADRCLNHALAGRKVYIPGVANQLLHFAGIFIPPTILANLIYRRWSWTRDQLSSVQN
jgi:short-subunit dehydrogenase